MANYRAVFIFPAMIGEGRFEFEAPAELLDDAPFRIVDTFLRNVGNLGLNVAVQDHDIQAAFNDRTFRIITALGVLRSHNGPPVPFSASIYEITNAVST
jgi:hypothetical protein